MNRTNTLRTTLFLLLFSLSSLSQPQNQEQEVRYITDILYVPMRSGPSNEYRIVTTRLKSGNKLVVLDRDPEEKWFKVATEKGVEGWVPSQYLIKRPSSRTQLAETSAKLAELEKQNTALRKKNRELLGTNESLNEQANSASSDKQKMSQELQEIKLLAADSINIDQRYRKLLEDHELLQTNLEALTVENDKLKSDKQLSFMFYGAGLILSGVFLAIVFPSLMPKKRYSEWK